MGKTEKITEWTGRVCALSGAHIVQFCHFCMEFAIRCPFCSANYKLRKLQKTSWTVPRGRGELCLKTFEKYETNTAMRKKQTALPEFGIRVSYVDGYSVHWQQKNIFVSKVINESPFRKRCGIDHCAVHSEAASRKCRDKQRKRPVSIAPLERSRQIHFRFLP